MNDQCCRFVHAQFQALLSPCSQKGHCSGVTNFEPGGPSPASPSPRRGIETNPLTPLALHSKGCKPPEPAAVGHGLRLQARPFAGCRGKMLQHCRLQLGISARDVSFETSVPRAVMVLNSNCKSPTAALKLSVAEGKRASMETRRLLGRLPMGRLVAVRTGP